MKYCKINESNKSTKNWKLNKIANEKILLKKECEYYYFYYYFKIFDTLSKKKIFFIFFIENFLKEMFQ